MKNLRKLIREAYIKQKVKKSLKEAIEKLLENDKDFMEEVKNVMMDNTEAPVKEPDVKPATPSTTPDPGKDPRKIPNPGPGIKPAPKAKIGNADLKKKDLNEAIIDYSSDELNSFINDAKSIISKKRVISQVDLAKIANKNNIESVDYNTFFKELPADKKRSAPPKGEDRVPVFALVNPNTKKPRIVCQVDYLDNNLLDRVIHMLKHELVHVKQSEKSNGIAGDNLDSPKDKKTYFENKSEIMAFSQSIADILVNQFDAKDIKQALGMIGKVELYYDIKKNVSDKVLNKYHKYIFLYLKNEFSKKQNLNEDAMDFPPGERDRPHPETQKRLEKRGDPKATPFSDVELFNREKDGKTTQEKIASKEYAELINKSKEVGKTNGWGDVFKILDKLAVLEKPYKQRLQQLAKKVVQKELGLPDEVMDNIVAKLLTPNEESIDDVEDQQTPEEEIPLSDEEKRMVGGEVKIRKIMNAMMMGSGYKLFDVLTDFKSELDSINPNLYPLYIRLNPNANLLLWQIPPSNTEIRRPAGSVKLEKKPDEGSEGTQVSAKAYNFAVLLHEIAKGAMEYLLIIRLDKFSDNLRRAIFKQADSYKEEHFMKILGPQIWKQVFYAIEIALDEYEEHNELYGLNNRREMLPLLINKMATMRTTEFINLIDDLLNPGQAEESQRHPPMERIKSMIHGINSSIKEFIDGQTEASAPTANFEIGDDNSDEIDAAINHKRNDWVDDVSNNALEHPEGDAKSYEEMDKNELVEELKNALHNEDYALAAKIRDLINSKS
jgi:hypothetical protein